MASRFGVALSFPEEYCVRVEKIAKALAVRWPREEPFENDSDLIAVFLVEGIRGERLV
jgi:hypothetical protein